MAIESRFSTSRNCIFREPFTHDSIAKNGGVITGGVSRSNGVATMDGTGYITYAGNKDLSNKNKFTIRMKARRSAVNKLVYASFNTDANHCVELLLHSDGKIYAINAKGGAGAGYGNDPHNDSDLHEFVFVFDGSGVANVDKVKAYIDGDSVALSFAGVIPAVTVSLGTFYIGKGINGNSEGSFELVEIYDSALTPEEVSLLYTNKLYKGFVEENCIMHADFTRKTSLNWKDTAGVHTDTDIEYGHNLGAIFNGATSVINYGSPNIFDFGTGSFSIEWIDTYPIIESGLFSGILGKGLTGSALAKSWGILTNGVMPNSLRYYESSTAGGAYVFAIDLMINIPDGKHHFVLVRDVDNDKILLYEGGSEEVSILYTVDQNITNTFNFTVKYGNTKYTSGILPYLRVYKGKALTALEVRQNYQYCVDRGYLT